MDPVSMTTSRICWRPTALFQSLVIRISFSMECIGRPVIVVEFGKLLLQVFNCGTPLWSSRLTYCVLVSE